MPKHIINHNLDQNENATKRLERLVGARLNADKMFLGDFQIESSNLNQAVLTVKLQRFISMEEAQALLDGKPLEE